VDGGFIKSCKSIFTNTFKSLQWNIKINNNPSVQISEFVKSVQTNTA